MSDWMIAAAAACEPLLELLRSGPKLQIDETTVQVLKEPGRDNHTKSYVWVARGGPPETPVLVYRYEPCTSDVEQSRDGTPGLGVYRQAVPIESELSEYRQSDPDHFLAQRPPERSRCSTRCNACCGRSRVRCCQARHSASRSRSLWDSGRS